MTSHCRAALIAANLPTTPTRFSDVFPVTGPIPYRRFTAATIREMRQARRDGVTVGELARIYNTSSSIMSRICNRRLYADVEEAA